MAWKIFNIETGELVKGGFEDEDAAKTWLENRFGESTDLDAYDINEMDDDEESDYDAEEEYVERDESLDESDDALDDDSDEDDLTEGLTEVDDLDY